MKVVILCGGKGSRMKELTDDIPKPLATVGGKPILWHIMKIYHHYGFNDFVLLLGYKGEKIKEYFMDYKWKNNNIKLHEDGSYEVLESSENWKITMIDTGIDTMTGGRIIKAKPLLENESFMLTYGDGLADINLSALVDFHHSKQKIATVTGIKKSNQYGVLSIEDDIATQFIEKPESNEIINGGFFIFNKEIFDYLGDSPQCILEKKPLMNLAKNKQLAVYRHDGFWTAMDTYKDILEVNKLWEKDEALWKVW